MHLKYILLLLLAFFTNTIYGQKKVDTLKTLEFLKSIYSDTDYLRKFFEKERQSSRYHSNPLTKVNWNKTYNEQDLARIVKEIKNEITFDLGMEKGAKLELSDTVKAYHHISVNFSLPHGIDEEFLEVSLILKIDL